MVISTRIEDAIAVITIDRPEAMNALDVPSQIELRNHLLAARDDDAVRVVVLTGTGRRAFCAGADLKSTPPSSDPYAAAWTAGDEVATQRGAYEGRPYRSLSAIARHITGTRWNGWAFFGLRQSGGSA